MIEIVHEKEQKFLLGLARKVMEQRKIIELTTSDLVDYDPILTKKLGGFVTIHKDGNLRGCIGYILPIRSLHETVSVNAYNCAFSDPRFQPVRPEELSEIEIEISVLSIPRKITFDSYAEILMKLKPMIHGVTIKKGYQGATFLPQVWEQLPSKEEFLTHLCNKAGMHSDEWKNIDGLEIEIYEAQVFK